ncbi:MAG TPA: hypothetical protein VHK47_17845 [Polyangia bacterium]|jgi:hypothetical protein|nr:hypothetical protein [Polyangia bacterium]
MFEHMIDGVRRASESSLQLQQEILKSWTRIWLTGAPGAAGTPGGEWSRGAQKRWLELGIEMMHKQREALDATFRAGIQLIEQAFQVGDAKNGDELRRMTEELWRKLFDLQKEQAEHQFRDFQSWVEKSSTLAQQDARS